MSNFDTIAGSILLGALIILFVVGIVSQLIKQKKTAKRIESEWQQPFKEPPLTERHVHVIEKHVVSEVVGVKTPRHRDVFYMTVQFDDGKTATYEIDKEIYRTIQENTNGTLAFVGDRVYGYCKD